MTTLGTALQPHATRVLLLGAGELGKEVVIALQRLGVEVIAADRYAHAPAMQVAHRACVLDMSDATALQTLIDDVQPHLIVPEIEAIATDVLMAVEQKQQAQVIPSALAVHLTMNRQGIRQLAAETLGLATSPYRFASQFEEFKHACEQIGYPCFVKPIMSSSGKGQTRITDSQQLPDAWAYAMQGGRVQQQTVIVEGQIDFDFEITLLTVRAFAADGKTVQTHFCDAIGHRQQDGDYVESWQPQPMSALALAEAKSIAQTITTALGGLGLFGVELFVKGDQVWFSEVSPRPHDTGLVTLASQFQSEFELHARAILGLPVNTERHSIAASAVIYAGQDGTDLQFSQLSQALSEPHTDLRLFAKPQGFVKRRMGVATARAYSVDEARRRASQAAQTVKIKSA